MAILALLVDGVVVQRFTVGNTEMTIGRLSDNDIHIEDAAVSSHHARISARANRYLPSQMEYYIEDLNSTNGSFINDSRIELQQLNHDDELRIAWNHFKFIDDEQPNFERTAVILEPLVNPA